MGFVALKCPNCSANIELDDSKEFGFCTFCGTKVSQEKIVIEHRGVVEHTGTVKVDESDKYQNMIRLANHAFESDNMSEAYDYYTHALEIHQTDYLPFVKKGICAGFLSIRGNRNSEVISGITSALSLAKSDEDKMEIFRQVMYFVQTKKVKKPSSFHNKSMCEDYSLSIFEHLRLLDQIYDIFSLSDDKTICDYSAVVIKFCKAFLEKISFENGVTAGKGKSKTDHEIFTPPIEQRNAVKEIQTKFKNERNKCIAPELERQQKAIQETKTKISALPMPLRILHFIFDMPMLLLAILLSLIAPRFGLVLLIIEIICYFVYSKIDKDKSAQTLFFTHFEQKKEYYETKRKTL